MPIVPQCGGVAAPCPKIVGGGKHGARQESDALAVENKIRILTSHLDKAYMDKLSGLLAEADFERIYARLKEERAVLEKQLTAMKQPDFSPVKRQQLAKVLVRRFVDSAFASRELLCSLIERIELTEDKR
mgnify:CR=1 FL=1